MVRESIPHSPDPSSDVVLPEPIFNKLLCLERKRAERSGRRFVLMLAECQNSSGPGFTARALNSLKHCIRDTDVTGWYRHGEVLGVIYTEVLAAGSSIVEILSSKAELALVDALGTQHASDIKLSFHVFPDDFEGHNPGRQALAAVYPDLAPRIDERRPSLVTKRAIDVVGSLALIVLLSPLLLVIACLVKLTSKGPVVFRQTRLGQFGEGFTFLKFRSMYTHADSSVHQEYIKSFIRERTNSNTAVIERSVYKLKNDSRITRVGAFLRRTSLDELPQLFNVLSGRMSLVGPRPPLPYEFSAYETWHKRRLFVKPGITGYWQIEGRSRVKFDEMVRMDIRYAKSWSLWLDVKILARTPLVVLHGNGAY
jgi:exopolysaccharide biosynthesis polyprenyl glycosylphosphotransferase